MRSSIKKLHKILLLPLALILFATSCEMVVDLDLPEHKPKLTVNGYFENNRPWKVHISSSVHIMDRKEPAKVENATVTIYEDGSLLEVLQHDTGGFYKGNTFPSTGRTYRIEVSAPDYETVTATDKLPAPVPVLSYTVRDSGAVNQWGEEVVEVRFTFNDPAGIDNFYLAEFKRGYGQSWDNRMRTLYFTTIDQDFEEGGGGLFTDQKFEGKTYTFTAFLYKHDVMYNPGTDNLLRIHLNSCSKTYYDYAITSNQQSWNNDDPFAEPIQVRSNVVNGYGVFAGKSVSEIHHQIQ